MFAVLRALRSKGRSTAKIRPEPKRDRKTRVLVNALWGLTHHFPQQQQLHGIKTRKVAPFLGPVFFNSEIYW